MHACCIARYGSVLEQKLQEAKAKKDTLKARAASAKSTKEINELLGNLSDSSNAYAAFEKMEEKVIALEAESEAIGMLGSGSKSGDNLEARFAMLEGSDTDSELVHVHLHTVPLFFPLPSHTLSIYASGNCD